jgi:hypothetical protein
VRPGAAWVVAALGAVVLVAGIATLWQLPPTGDEASVAPLATPSATTSEARPTPEAAPTPTPPAANARFPANATAYDVWELPQVNVFAVIPQLPVDDDAFTAPLPLDAVPLGIGAPVWADPAGEPVAYLPREYPYGGTLVPVVEEHGAWIKVLLTGRQAVPSQGDSAQLTGWMRRADVELAPTDVSVAVSISARTIDIVRDGVTERVASDFGWGAAASPTPLGRAFIMITRVVPEYAYTRGYPIVYLSVQSPTLDGFGGADVAVAAFHYHDERSGPVSNGCMQVDPAAITKLAELPPGTPVMIAP